MYKEKYLKYKTKYLELKNQVGGFKIDVTIVDDFSFSYDDDINNGIFKLSILDSNNNEVEVSRSINKSIQIIVKLKNDTDFKFNLNFKNKNININQSSTVLMSYATYKDIVLPLISKSINIVSKYIPTNYHDFETKSLKNYILY